MTSSVTGPNAYVGNASAHEVANRLAGAAQVLILTHTKPDGDAFGSALALARALRRVDVQVRVLFYPPVLASFFGLADEGEVEVATDDAMESGSEQTIVVVDTGSWSQLGPLAPLVRDRSADTIVIDHHVNGSRDMAETRLIDGQAPAACQLVADVVLALLDMPDPSHLPATIAQPLYLGLATDTGWFRHPSVLPSTMRLAADLLETGIDQNELYQRTEQADRPERLALAQRALASLTFIAQGRGAIMLLTQDDFRETGAQLSETGGLIDLPQSVGAVRVTVLLYEPEPGLTRLSMRSKAGPGAVDVNAIAQQFGGGGHRHAAGARIEKPAHEARLDITRAIEQALA